ncbi:hypothetical protein HDU98_010156 [Podochytrium sp. JEL0797]|nr:hypothetical protein HDU98_010156 [Podochytrium sp. JEL0797]
MKSKHDLKRMGPNLNPKYCDSLGECSWNRRLRYHGKHKYSQSSETLKNRCFETKTIPLSTLKASIHWISKPPKESRKLDEDVDDDLCCESCAALDPDDRLETPAQEDSVEQESLDREVSVDASVDSIVDATRTVLVEIELLDSDDDPQELEFSVEDVFVQVVTNTLELHLDPVREVEDNDASDPAFNSI